MFEPSSTDRKRWCLAKCSSPERNFFESQNLENRREEKNHFFFFCTEFERKKKSHFYKTLDDSRDQKNLKKVTFTFWRSRLKRKILSDPTRIIFLINCKKGYFCREVLRINSRKVFRTVRFRKRESRRSSVDRLKERRNYSLRNFFSEKQKNLPRARITPIAQRLAKRRSRLFDLVET